ncbi:MAG: ATP-binding protein [Azospirillum sp.]|nr:ATP-binding protein [Azospirillum sp.]
MPTPRHLLALLKSHGDGDDAGFFATAMEAAADSARGGDPATARAIRDAIEGARRKRAMPMLRSGPIPISQPKGELATLFAAEYSDLRLDDLVVSSSVKTKLLRVLAEQRSRDKLEGRGLHPRQKLLLTGQPGTGKTMSARVLAGELGLPLFSVRLEALITKFMGETAAKLSLVFDAMRDARGVYLFDEFDAIGGKRTNPNDVGEARRILNTFLIQMEKSAGASLIVAATNHPELLDRALFRRFDDVIEYALPDDGGTRMLLERVLSSFDTTKIDWKRVAKSSQGLSPAEIVRVGEDTAKEAVLRDLTQIETLDLVATLIERIPARSSSKMRMKKALRKTNK